jgi:hypothetical protein
MWRETIARWGWFERPAGRLLTGPLAFLVAGAIDVTLALRALASAD